MGIEPIRRVFLKNAPHINMPPPSIRAWSLYVHTLGLLLLFGEGDYQGSAAAEDVVEVDVSDQMVHCIGHDEGGDLIALHPFNGLCDGDVLPDGLGGAGHEGVDPFIPEIPSGADKAPDIAVGEDAEQDMVPIRYQDEPLVLFIHLPDRFQYGCTPFDTGNLRTADHDVTDFCPEP